MTTVNNIFHRFLIAGKVLTTAININCQACEDNEGTCVEDSAQTNGIFCECQISRSGVNCEIIHGQPQ